MTTTSSNGRIPAIPVVEIAETSVGKIDKKLLRRRCADADTAQGGG